MLKKKYKLSFNIAYNIAGNFVQGLVALLLIPITTQVLDAGDYGVFGIGLVVLNLSSAMCDVGASYVIYAYAPKINVRRRGAMFSTLILMVGSIGCIVSIFFYLLWTAFSGAFDFLSQFGNYEIILVCLTIPLRALWVLVVPILVSVRGSKTIALSLVLQALLNFILVVLTVFIFNSGRLSLFIGSFVSSVGSVALCMSYLWRHCLFKPNIFWFKQSGKIALGAWLVGVLENCRSVFESFLLQKFVGIFLLGNFFHARLYQGMIMQGTNAINNVIWPIALEESKIKSQHFTIVKNSWNYVYFIITFIGLFFCFYGAEVIGYISNNKFNIAASFVPWLVIFSLIQNAGKPATAVLFYSNNGNLLSKLRTVLIIIDIILMMFLVQDYGIYAVIGISIFDMLLMRICIRIMAQRIQKIPFTDWMIIFGVLFIAIGMIIDAYGLTYIKKFVIFSALVSIDAILLIRNVRKI